MVTIEGNQFNMKHLAEFPSNPHFNRLIVLFYRIFFRFALCDTFKLLHDQWEKEMPLMRKMNSVMLRTSTNYEWNWVKLDFFKLFYQDISKERINWKDRNLFYDEISSSLKTIRTIYWIQKYSSGMIDSEFYIHIK